jgi:hypothetical protein
LRLCLDRARIDSRVQMDIFLQHQLVDGVFAYRLTICRSDCANLCS